MGCDASMGALVTFITPRWLRLWLVKVIYSFAYSAALAKDASLGGAPAGVWRETGTATTIWCGQSYTGVRAGAS